jgi:hypothetical protein
MEEILKRAEEVYTHNLKKKDWRSAKEKILSNASLKKVFGAVLKKQEMKNQGILFCIFKYLDREN